MTEIRRPAHSTKGRDSARQGHARKVDEAVDALAAVLSARSVASVLKVAAAEAEVSSRREVRLWESPTNAFLKLLLTLIDAGALPDSAVRRTGKMLIPDKAVAAALAVKLHLLLSLSAARAPRKKASTARSSPIQKKEG